ncbi:type II toxin-antitoxin system RelE/ParE family toxin [Flavobacterium sp.]|jgi:plasmid stabilization system protein ParE|uniref:type II toxin-antitoxin system RelE/ParE family toxin n=1 Tax=Flavobacterium sp. TaxID=239 RepID=UPI002C22FE59|nr:type II toxin-antitoxin system RelE/ParE family toxin [Flavobacterium sp.]HQA75434.1 type II toxin-antitoxin system RelE/ParE family toxin [Flavobacterium sp.]
MEVIWSPQAKKDFWNNIDYLEAEWTFKDVVNFIEKVEKTINLLKKSNINFVSANYKEVNKVVVTKQITLYYRLNSKTLELLRFWNTYQDLENFKL